MLSPFATRLYQSRKDKNKFKCSNKCKCNRNYKNNKNKLKNNNKSISLTSIKSRRKFHKIRIGHQSKKTQRMSILHPMVTSLRNKGAKTNMIRTLVGKTHTKTVKGHRKALFRDKVTQLRFQIFRITAVHLMVQPLWGHQLAIRTLKLPEDKVIRK